MENLIILSPKDTKFVNDRERILKIISEKSGLTRNELQKISKMSKYNLEKILNNLEGANEIQIKSIFGKYRIITSGENDQDVIIKIALKMPAYKKMIKYLLVHPQEQLDELSEQIQKTRSTTFNHLEKLSDSGIIKKSFIDRKLYYSLKNSKKLFKMIGK